MRRFSVSFSACSVTLAAVLLAGCATVPDLGATPEPRAAATLDSTQTLRSTTAGTTQAWPEAAWWTAFGDPQLDGLIDEALKSSPDVTAAVARINAADALARQTGAALLPGLSVDGTVGGNQQSKNLGIPPQFVPDGIQDTGRLTATASFDLDLWGKNRAALAAATSEANAARVDADQARLMLATNVAAAYAELAQYHAERDVAVEALRVRGATATLTAQRVAVGVDALGSQRQADSRVPAARADIAALDEAIALTRNRLAALIGAGPDRGLAIARPTLAAGAVGVPDSAGIDLIGRRPDIVAARLRAEAAAKRIKVAKADFYPNINLSAVVGLQSLGLGRLIAGNSSYGSAGPAFSLPIFDGGRIRGRYVQARANYDVAVAQYDSTLIAALHEAADAVASRNALDHRLSEQKQALTAAADASRIAALRYKGGLSTLLPVLTADDFELSTRRAVVDLEARRVALDIALIRALGGGYNKTPEIAGGTK
ncbi:efflux transporter outer membrane subunit [Sphingomonas sp. ERG5]|uniref:efflux transporter outer membrane subunit n=1 Tax=Sphingomonas sp. ERG5 TaxID=1381597 RepID=UPI00054C0B46|nr:efflux transporter outer membrane subunit [Sphingomonas sp. ERG5]